MVTVSTKSHGTHFNETSAYTAVLQDLKLRLIGSIQMGQRLDLVTGTSVKLIIKMVQRCCR